jgi:cytochrome c oxidase cbb3-type subunit 3
MITMADNKRIDEPTGTQTVGHEWDGIEELNTPLPRWWLWTFYATCIWALGYVILYPAWPLIDSATAGTLGWSSRGDLAAEMVAETRRRAPIMAALSTTPPDQLLRDERLLRAAVAGGESAFKVHCVQCHGSGADGIRAGSGYPNLNDDDWLWGGTITDIEYTLVHGIRNPDHAETRMSMMPAFGRDGILTSAQIADVVSHIRTISGQERGSASSTRGAALFAANCAVCHGPGGEGMRSLGAPRLTDGIWLYGGTRAALTQTITNARQGVMPRWGNRLDAVTIRMLAAYVHARGGGEASAPTVSAAAVAAAPSAPPTEGTGDERPQP